MKCIRCEIVIVLTAFLAVMFLIVVSFSSRNDELILEKSVGQTTLKISNKSEKDSILTYLTLGSDTTFITDVNGVFGIQESGLQGSFYMMKDSVYIYTYKNKGISGNISFGSPPINCKTDQWPDGVNLFEVTLNNAGSVSKAQETFDISNVAGVNALGEISTRYGGAWIANGDTVTNIHNDSIYQNSGNYGVFPVGCDICTASKAPQKCKHPLRKATPQSKHICNVSRSAEQAGGTVEIIFKGWSSK